MLTRIDTALGRVSMYRLVFAALAVVLGWAVIAAAFGLTGFSASGILLTTAAALAGVLLGTVGGLLFMRKSAPGPHALSSPVTGLILGLILFPGTDWRTLVGAGVAGLAAGLSKYLLVWRGRHLANPAAVGLIVVTLTGLNSGAWWVGSGVLLPVVALAGALVAWRARKVVFALSFAVPAFLLVTIGYLAFGTAVSSALWWAIASSPIVFLATFMLTEPLTAPPRLAQRLWVGLLVACLLAAPMLLGWDLLTPEVALVLGNVLAFAFGPRGAVALRLLAVRKQGDVLDLDFAPSRPLRLAAGQYVEVTVPQALSVPGGRADPRGTRRVFSLASQPTTANVRLVTRLTTRAGQVPSPVKVALASLEPGGVLRVASVGGDFLLPSTGRVAMIAAGIGVTPFLAQLDAIARGVAPAPPAGWDVVLVHAVRSASEVLELNPSAAQVPEIPGGGVLGAVPERAALPAGVRLVLVVPPGTDRSELPAAWRVVESALLTREALGAAVPDLAEREVMVSGSPAAVAAVRAAARELGVRRVRTDVFLGC